MCLFVLGCCPKWEENSPCKFNEVFLSGEREVVRGERNADVWMAKMVFESLKVGKIKIFLFFLVPVCS